MFSEVMNGILASRPQPHGDNVTGPTIKLGLIPAGKIGLFLKCSSANHMPGSAARVQLAIQVMR